jgi:hypothetical protein
MREPQDQAVVDSEKARNWQAQIEVRATGMETLAGTYRTG